MKTKLVKMQATIVYEREVPEHFTKKDIEFQLNEGTWCADSFADELVRYVEKREKDERGCMCFEDQTKFTYLEDIKS